MFGCLDGEGRWIACAGVVELDGLETGGDRYGKQERAVSRFTYHEWMDDVKDGGIASYLLNVGGRDVPCYATEPDNGEEPMAQDDVSMLRKNADLSAEARGDNIKVECHCGGVRLQVKPPAYDEKSEGWYVPTDHSKYYSRICCCRSCRLALGFTFQPWAYVPPNQILTAEGDQVIFGPEAKSSKQIAKLAHYQSSDSVLRSFCTDCGATIFYQSFDRAYIINIGVGVVRSKVGNGMVGEWLAWDRGQVSKRDETVDEEVIEAWLHA